MKFERPQRAATTILAILAQADAARLNVFMLLLHE